MCEVRGMHCQNLLGSSSARGRLMKVTPHLKFQKRLSTVPISAGYKVGITAEYCRAALKRRSSIARYALGLSRRPSLTVLVKKGGKHVCIPKNVHQRKH